MGSRPNALRRFPPRPLVGGGHGPRQSLRHERLGRWSTRFEARLGDQFPKADDDSPSRFLHRVVPQHQARSLDLFCDAEQLRAGLDRQGLRLSGFEFSQAHHYWRRGSFLTVLGWYWLFGWLLISAVATPTYPLPVVVLAWVWGGLFAVNITLKEVSLSRYPEWEQCKRHTWRLLPPIL